MLGSGNGVADKILWVSVSMELSQPGGEDRSKHFCKFFRSFSGGDRLSGGCEQGLQ